MKLTNNEIYTYANQLMQAFDNADQKLPIKINFYLQKNKNTLFELAKQIEQSRLDIAKSYGTYKEEIGQYEVDPDKIDTVKKELEDLFNLEQEVEIYTISIDTVDDSLVLTTSQMEALMFMIN